MRPEKEKLELLLQIVAQTVGYTPRTPTDFVNLASAIATKTGRTIGLSTLKRLWGYVKDQSGTTFATLSLLSRYVGYNDWDSFCTFASVLNDYSDSGFNADDIVESRLLEPGTKVALSLGSNKRCLIVKTEHPDKFEVVSSENIKLMAGDSVRIACMALGRPFYATDCRRGANPLGNYSGAQSEGIKEITIKE